ncbi:MAG TPA: 50S ribosomal protein L4 [Thermodesulfobacteriota bacterium]|nr:50S ribosomal protein L4 [Thermodesulfobacteriota bacterium]
MAVFDIYDQEKNRISEIDLDDKIFGAKVDKNLFHEVVKMQLANRRGGNACTKTRSEVSGGGRKPWRQKGTGRARAGSNRSPLWVGGGVVFGPKPRDYSYSLPKKVRRAALKSALSLKVKEGKLLIVDNLNLEEIKTKAFVSLLKRLAVEDALIVDSDNVNLERSARNLHTVKVLRPEGLNVYDILKYECLLLTKQSAEKIQERLRQ